MLQVEQLTQIRALLEKTPTLRLNQIAQLLCVSEATVRRDVAAMEKDGVLKRVYGGVILNKEDMPLALRSFQHSDEKDEIGKLAAKLVKDGQQLNAEYKQYFCVTAVRLGEFILIMIVIKMN